MNATNKVGVHILPIIKEDLITTDIINQLDIADGLKELLISKNFTLNMLLDTPISELAEIGIDNYIVALFVIQQGKSYNGDRH